MPSDTKRSAKLLAQLRNHRACFEVALLGELPSDQIPVVLEAMEQNYRSLLPRLPDIGARNLMNENLLISAWFLAFIRALEVRGLPDPVLARATERAAKELVGRRSRLSARLQAFLVGNRIFQFVLERLAKRTHRGKAREGFVVTFVRGDGRGFDFGYDITRCAIVELFAAEGAARHAPLMCKVDYLTSSLAGLKLERKGTIAEGHARCDFRFVKGPDVP